MLPTDTEWLTLSSGFTGWRKKKVAEKTVSTLPLPLFNKLSLYFNTHINLLTSSEPSY